METIEEFVNRIDTLAKNSIYYAASTGGFYVEGVNTAIMPGDAVEITPEQYATLLSGNGEIIPDENGYPTVKTIEYDIAWHEADCKGHKNSLLAQSDWIVTVSLEAGTPVPKEWQDYRQALRDYKTIANYPYKAKMVWPTEPGK